MQQNNFLYYKSHVESKFIKKNIPNIHTGDSVKIKILIKEGNKNRIQISEGVVISQKNTSINRSITIRKIIQNVGVEKVYLIHSPLIVDINIINKAKVRKSKLYYLRQRSGKATKLKTIK